MRISPAASRRCWSVERRHCFGRVWRLRHSEIGSVQCRLQRCDITDESLACSVASSAEPVAVSDDVWASFCVILCTQLHLISFIHTYSLIKKVDRRNLDTKWYNTFIHHEGNTEKWVHDKKNTWEKIEKIIIIVIMVKIIIIIIKLLQTKDKECPHTALDYSQTVTTVH